MKLTKDEFLDVTGLLESSYGLHTPSDKQREFESKLDAVGRMLGIDTARGLIEAVERSPEARQALVNGVTVGESYFFRNHPHFDVMREHVFPELLSTCSDRRSLRIWCAGCAAGEEPYSIAILLAEDFPELRDWKITILATDVNTRLLARAREAVYTSWSFRGVDKRLIEKYFRREAGNRFPLDERIVRAVDFRWLNLAARPFDPAIVCGEFDLVVCRNVLIYFAFPAANETMAEICGQVRRGGFLLVGHAESFPCLAEMAAIYSRGTYYFQKPWRRRIPTPSAAPRHSLIIPGLGVRGTRPPESRIARAPSPTARPDDGTRTPALAAMPIAGIESAVEEARRLADAGEVERAFALLSSETANGKMLDSRAFFLLALLADQTGRVPDAVKFLKQAIFLERDLVVGHYYLGVIFDREGEKELARRYFRNAGNLLEGMNDQDPIGEVDGITAGRLREIVEQRALELEME